MKKYIKILIILLSIVALIIIIPKFNLTAKIIDENKYSYTKALCNESNYCEDYIIECEGKKTPKLTATGFSVQHDMNWEDSRINTENYCE